MPRSSADAGPAHDCGLTARSRSPTCWSYGLATVALVADSQARGVGTVFLVAGDDDSARGYERVGFRRVGTACATAPAG